MERKIIIILILSILAAVLTLIRETKSPESTLAKAFPPAKKQLSLDRIRPMADTTLVMLGIEKKNIKPVKNQNDVRVGYPKEFDILRFIRALSDSLSEFEVTVISMENPKNNSAVVQIKSGDKILQSYLFSQEIQKVEQKGVSPLVKKKAKGKSR
ncbi:MAG: hypothetical protein H3C35_04060 [Bacteroidetes bacterium]|nr:hypothetical protein [Bacteroidota bacterium]